MPVKKRILITGPYGKVGGVKTHVDYLQHILRPYGTKIKITSGMPFLQMLRERVLFRPKVVIYNVSAYRNNIIRNMVVRTIMPSLRTKHILHLHGGCFSDVDLANNKVWQLLLKFYFRRFDQIFCLTNEQYSTVSMCLGHSRSVKKIYNYVDIPDKRRLNKADKNLNLLYIGRLHPLKGICEAVEAVRQIKDDRIRFWIIGSGELETELAGIYDHRIDFVGKKVGTEKSTFLSKAHVFLLPSSWPEGLPYVLLEAAAHGLALISTPTGAIDQVLSHGKNGFFVKPGDVPMLAHTIEKLLADRSMVLKMGKESRRICEERFALKNFQQIYDNLFQEWYGSSATSNTNISHAE